jgi:hypothetical protein
MSPFATRARALIIPTQPGMAARAVATAPAITATIMTTPTTTRSGWMSVRA